MLSIFERNSHCEHALVRARREGLHPRLHALLDKHLHHPWRKPIAAHSRQAFANLAAQIQAASGSLVLDSGCGVGAAAGPISANHPDCLILAIDKSQVRLDRARRAQLPDNVLSVRAELADFWRLLHQHSIRLRAHYLLYPNPWPKVGQLARRWHGHPVFPHLLALGGRLELRSNWPIYVQEFAAAVRWASRDGISARAAEFQVLDPWTPFERKYLLGGQKLYRYRADLSAFAQEIAATATGSDHSTA